MKKVTYLLSMLALVGTVTLNSCKDEVDPTPTPTPNECEDAKATPFLATATGDATIVLKNFSGTSINVEAGNILALAVEITKASSRTKKLRLFESDCEYLIGTEIDLSAQPKGGKNGIDLRNTDDAQIRNVNYTVPTGMNPIYLTIEIDEAGGNKVYKQLTLNVSGSGIVDTWSSVELGGNSNALASRMASGTGLTYTACNAAANIDYIDITYAVALAAPNTSYISSNPARFVAPISLAASTATCGDDGVLPTSGGKASYFKKYTGTVVFADATNTDLEALDIKTTDNQYAEVAAAGDVFAFLNPNGSKGLIKVESVNQLNNTAGSITVSVKIQR